jgi:ribonuclease HII
MCRALAALPCIPGCRARRRQRAPRLPCQVETIVKGDATIASIAAASIVAKVVRDRLMKRLAGSFSGLWALHQRRLQHRGTSQRARPEWPLALPSAQLRPRPDG